MEQKKRPNAWELENLLSSIFVNMVLSEDATSACISDKFTVVLNLVVNSTKLVMYGYARLLDISGFEVYIKCTHDKEIKRG